MTKRVFPCCICGTPLAVRETKKGKPYVICNQCGMQMFVRIEPGIDKFEALIAEAEQRNVWVRLRELEQRYRKTCSDCGYEFWIEENLRVTHDGFFGGRLIGYRCPYCKKAWMLEQKTGAA
jgi:DNA-directed RNA polymerase subunit RPC12/RpoP